MPRKKNNRKKIQAAKQAVERAKEARNRPRGWRDSQDTMHIATAPNSTLMAAMMIATSQSIFAKRPLPQKEQTDGYQNNRPQIIADCRCVVSRDGYALELFHRLSTRQPIGIKRQLI